MLNVENRATLADRFGRETKGWAGKKVTLITRSVQGPNGPCQGIRFADAPVGEVIGDEAVVTRQRTSRIPAHTGEVDCVSAAGPSQRARLQAASEAAQRRKPQLPGDP